MPPYAHVPVSPTQVHGMQLFVRMIGGMLMLILLAHLFGGIMYAQFGDLPTAQFVLYWIKCVLLALALCLVAVVDVLLQNLAIDLLTENHGLAADSKQ